MLPIGYDELTGLQTTQESAMFDTCNILSYSATLDDLGEAIPAYTAGADISCGVAMTTGRENWRTDMTVENIDATLRLPITTTIKSTDKIQVTKRFGVTAPTIIYEIIGEVRRGPSGLQVDIRRVLP